MNFSHDNIYFLDLHRDGGKYDIYPIQHYHSRLEQDYDDTGMRDLAGLRRGINEKRCDGVFI